MPARAGRREAAMEAYRSRFRPSPWLRAPLGAVAVAVAVGLA